jgi:hypothetical protein
MSNVQVFVLSTNEFNELISGAIDSITYAPYKPLSVGDAVKIRPYEANPVTGDLPSVEARVIAVKELPCKMGQIKSWVFFLNVQLIMF